MTLGSPPCASALVAVPRTASANTPCQGTTGRMGLTLMTSSGYLRVMKGVRIAELKARLSEYLRGVRRGHILTVLDRSTPIAWIIPYTSEAVSLTVRQPSPDSPGLHRIALPPPLDLEVDIVAVLLEERQGER